MGVDPWRETRVKEGWGLVVHFLSGCVTKINTPWPVTVTVTPRDRTRVRGAKDKDWPPWLARPVSSQPRNSSGVCWNRSDRRLISQDISLHPGTWWSRRNIWVYACLWSWIYICVPVIMDLHMRACDHGSTYACLWSWISHSETWRVHENIHDLRHISHWHITQMYV